MKQPAINVERWRELEDALRRLAGFHAMLLETLSAKREAIRRAQIDQIEPLCVREKQVHLQILEWERRRVALVGALVPKGAGPVTLALLVQHAPPEIGVRLGELGESIRVMVEQVKRESSIIRQAADALSQHMSGLVQTIHAAMSSSRVYGRRGRIQSPMAGAGLSAVDVRS